MSNDSRINGDQHQLPALDRKRLIFLNFQTSGQDGGSWPIEIGTPASNRMDQSASKAT